MLPWTLINLIVTIPIFKEIKMSDTLIKDQNGNVLARIRIENNGFQRIYKNNNHYLGFYNSNTNTTHFGNGSLFCRGNALTALINN